MGDAGDMGDAGNAGDADDMGGTELADSTQRLASRAYYSKDYTSQEKIMSVLHALQAVVEEELQLKCAERGCNTLKMALATVEIQEQHTRKGVCAARVEKQETGTYLKLIGEKLKALLGEIKDNREQRKQWAGKWE